MATGQSLTFGALLRRHRRAAGLTQEELAERARLSVETISGLERGLSRSPHRESIALLADGLGLTPDERKLFDATARRRDDEPAMDSRVPPIIDRTHESGLIDFLLVGKGPPVLLIAGEPGIGKTRLLREAAIRGSASGWAVLQGGCARRGGQAPYAGILEALRFRIASRGPAQVHSDLRRCEWLVRLLPELADAGLAAIPTTAASPEEDRRQVFGAVSRFLTNTAGPAGTLLVLDDLQWAGVDALDLIMAILLSPTATSVRIVGAYRNTELHPTIPLATTLGDLARAGLATQVTVGPLTLEDSRLLLQALLWDNDAAALDLREEVIKRANGVPFFLASYAQGLHDGMGSAPESDNVPWDVAETIRQRIAVLPAAAADVLSAAAAADRTVTRSILMSIVSGPDRTNDRILEALDAACHDRLLESVGFDGYRFTHNVIRDVIWHDLGSATRAALHQQVGEALERESRETAPEVLAYHFGRGGDHAKEILYLERAGDKARTLFANGAAEAFYRELMERLDQFSRPADAARAREKLADILRITARYDEALEVLDRAAQLYRRAGAPSLGYWHVMAQWGRVHARRGTPESGIERIQALLNASHAEEPSAGLAALEITLAELYYVSGHYSEQLTAAERGAAFARALHDDRLITQANQWRSTAMLFLGQSDEAIPILKEVMFQSEEIGDLSYHLYALNHVALAYIQRGEFSNSDRYIQRGLETATLRGDAVQMALMTYYRGVLNVYIGDWKVARGAFEHAVALVRQVATAWTSAYPLLGLGHLCLLEGQWDAAGRFLQEAITVADRSGNLQALRNALAPLIERDLLEGRPKVARGRLDRLLDRQNAQEDEGVAQALALLAWTQLEQDELDRAAESASRGEARARADHNQIALVEVLRVRAMLAMRHRHWDEGTALLAEALTHSRNMPNPYQEARVLYLAGVLAFQSAHPEVARPHLEQAVQILTRLGERLYLDHVEQALARLSS